MDFNGNWDILGVIMEMKDKEEYLDKVEKIARNNFARVLKAIDKSSSSSCSGWCDLSYSQHLQEPKILKLDKSKKFFWKTIMRGPKQGQVRKIFPKSIKENEAFMYEIEEHYEDYENYGDIFNIELYLPYKYYNVPYQAGGYLFGEGDPTWRDYPKGLSLEEFTDWYIWDNGIHYEIRWSHNHYCYYVDWKYRDEIGSFIRKAAKENDEIEKEVNIPNGREKHKELFKEGPAFGRYSIKSLAGWISLFHEDYKEGDHTNFTIKEYIEICEDKFACCWDFTSDEESQVWR